MGRIVVDRDKCISAATCLAFAPNVFALDEEMKAFVTNPKGDDDETILAAAKSCPELAIFLYDEEGNQIFP
ncbi:MAG: hypothetical protein A3C80_00650 [Candidatus Ryanbacteria bacterium RIFCSPHIGHO2_02_FULL_45_43]|uniref:Ferredoxin n=1 Tax=Candidatus Ryanbacteria bacterium RIFCSPHIGHO2_01_45_13 TaxID=1802112 RepID=A0A1G2FXG3_9BACT|nr:MAG: hypothetical protein A2718_02040 [Candidatus Ryanbacteria bacterium RIFCSPHIGHO2_01_FULL_44_130]OGZ42759.1 MAG: hypothetical protein A2W41_03025 [Candidatus Ryanbacteria bacterium RIFCSPHIGHO2_01_45_13]OGZ48854.1 MAG: hypothetical protein A3C80_00650 [Candidatus Ryanbacteria bacterium RIFCSPHIGHO2_02_FULL_45_43]OGZ50886.1 MAG: hypothetical protein A3E55_02670 [Candidatus Ryanbacteria bacterium RIFCSPHIGHO2_12_FULL_44_20]OGZ52117.1 MAG: hypothetical protein A3A17_01255 [Candidatus Ryanba